MKFDFETIPPRKGHDAIAIDALGCDMPGCPGAPKDGFDAIPMWVADMNFVVTPSIKDAILDRLNYPTFGYFSPSDEYFNSIKEWHKKRNGIFSIENENIGYENGVLGGVVSALAASAAPGDPILVHSPTYVGFTGVLNNNGYKIIHSPLVLDSDGIWRMDFDDMDKKIKENNIHTAIFCSPHNPCGRVWERWEIEKAMDVYKNNDCLVISDEIWSDIILNGNKHIPTQSVSEDAKMRTVALYAPSKTFNLAGMVGSYHIIYNKAIRDRVMLRSGKSHYNSMNVLSMHAQIGALSEIGMEWTDELCSVISENINYTCDYIKANFEGISFSKPQGTYMLLIDCKDWCEKNGKSIDDVLKAGWDVGVAWQPGKGFLAPNSIRINFALPTWKVKEAVDRMEKFVFNAK